MAMSDLQHNPPMPPPLPVEQAAAGLTNAVPWQRLLAAGLWPAAKPQQLLIVITGLFSLLGITTAAVVGYKLATGSPDRTEIDGSPSPFEDIVVPPVERADAEPADAFRIDPQRADAFRIDPQRRSATMDLPLDVAQLPNREQVCLEVQPEGFPACEVVPAEGPPALRSAVIRVLEPGGDGDAPFLDVAVQLDVADRIGLTVELTAHVPQVAETGTPEIRRVPTPISIADLETIQDRYAGTSGRYQAALQEIEADLRVRTASFREVDGELFRKKGSHANLDSSTVPPGELREKVEALEARLAVEIQRLEREHQRLSDAVKEKEDEKKRLLVLVQLDDQGAAWCRKMAVVLEQLRGGAEVRYRIYTETDGKQVDLLLGQDSPNPDAGDLLGPPPGPPAAPPDSPPPPPKPPPRVSGPFADVSSRNFHLPLPNWNSDTGSDSANEVELAKIRVDSPQECELSLVGTEQMLDAGLTFVMKREDERNVRSWQVWAKALGTIGRGQRIATFTLEDECLKFKWDPKATSVARPRSLQYCLLEIGVGEDSVRCVLANPDEVDPVQIGVEEETSTSSLPLDSASIPRRDNLRWDLQLIDFPRSALMKQCGLTVDEATVIQVFEPDEAADKRFLDVHVHLSLDPEPELVFSMTSHQKLLTPGTQDVHPSEEPISLKHLAEMQRYCSKSRLEHLATDLKKTDSQIDSIQKSLDGVREKLRKIDQELKNLHPGNNATEREKAAVRQKRGWLQAERTQLDESHRTYARNLSLAREGKADKEFLRDFIQENAVWCDRMARVFEQLHTKSKVQFRVYTEVEGRQVEVLRSKGYPSNKP